MTNTQPKGFIARSKAVQNYNRSQRALQRDLDAALRTSDTALLESFRLVTKDSDVRSGTEVTIELVKSLTSKGMNPVWYVSERWLNETYGKKGAPRPQPKEGSARKSPLDQEPIANRRVVEASPAAGNRFEDQIAERDEQIRYLRKELDIKNEQIQEANARTRESNKLMEELQKMLAGWQERAFEAIPARAEPRQARKSASWLRTHRREATLHRRRSRRSKEVAGER